MPIETPAVTVNRICGSGLEAINTAARYIQVGDADVAVAGGAENMTMMPYYLRQARAGYRMGNGVIEDGILHMLGDPFSKLAHGRHRREPRREVRGLPRGAGRGRDALAGARRRGHRIGQVQGRDRPGRGQGRQEETVTIDTDEHPRQTTMEALGKLRPAFKEGGMVTAGNASGINDGAAAVVVAQRRTGPRARPEAAAAPRRARRSRR